MKTKMIATCIFSLILSACAAPATSVPENLPAASLTIVMTSTATPVLTAIAAVDKGVSGCRQAPRPLSSMPADYTEPDPATWVMLMKPVREYFYYRKQAVVTGNIQVLWERYPALSQGEDIREGLNAEAFFVENMKGLKPFDGNMSPESYEPMKVIVSGDQAAVLTHGSEMYLFREADGQLDESGSELKIILFMCSNGSGQWTVYQTHDISGP
jgi:hypothetical protein